MSRDFSGTFLDVEESFAEGFAGVCRVHLVGLLVAGLGRGVEGVAEGAVEGGGVLGRVGEDRDSKP